MGKSKAEIEITASSSRLTAGLAAAGQKIKQWSGTVARGVSKAFSGAMKVANKVGVGGGEAGKNALGHLGGEIMTRGMDAIVDGANNVRDFERNLVRMQIAMDGTKTSTGRLRGEIRQISKDTGIGTDEVLAGAAAYVGFTGDAAGATKAAKLFADVSAATGATTTDIAQAMAALKTSMGITADTGEAAFSALIVQGKGGAVEIKDMAGELAALAPQFALFKGGKDLGGLREMGAGFQVIMKNSATASDAATKYAALMTALGDPRTLKALSGMGIAVKDNKGKLLDATTIFHRLAESKTLFAKENLSKAFGRAESRLAVLALKENIATYDELKAAAEDTGAVQRDKMTFLESDAGRIDAAINRVKVTIAEAFTPERITAFTNAVEELAGKIGPVVDAVGKIGGVLGSVFGAGRSIRGTMGGDTNQFRKQLRDNGSWIDGQWGQQLTPAQRAANFNLKRNAAGYDAGVANILGGEKNERTTPESIRRAYLASQAQGGFENVGIMTAGQQYLRNAGVTPEQAAQAYGKEQNRIMADGLKQIADAIEKAKPVTKLGDNQIKASTDKATAPRRSTH